MIRKAAGPTPSNARKLARRIQRDNVGAEDIIVDPGILPKRSRNEQALVPRSIATKKANIPKPENEENMKGWSPKMWEAF